MRALLIAGKSLWPIVAMFAVGMTAVVSILVFVPPGNQAAGQAVVAILGLLGPLLAGVWVTQHISAKVGEVKEQVNGRMTQLINKVPDHPCPQCQGQEPDDLAQPGFD